MTAIFPTLFRRVRVSRTERVAVIRNGQYDRLLGPGRHLVWTFGAEVDLVTYDLRRVTERIARSDVLPDALPGTRVVAVEGTEIAIVRVDEVVHDVLMPGRYRVWEAVEGVTITPVDVFTEPQPLGARDRMGDAVGPYCSEATATSGQAVVLLHDRQPVRSLPPGRYRVWKAGPYELVPVSLALDVVEPAAQDLMTKDEVPVRIKAAVSTRIVDPVQSLREPRHASQVYGAVQLALREVLAAHTLDGLIEARESLSTDLLARVREALPEVGVAVEAAYVKDVILSAETKALVSRVTLARKEAEALAITRREEVASTRQQANTAKVLAANPVLLRLKELEALSEIASRIDKLVVVGSPDVISGTVVRAIGDVLEA